MIVLDAVVLIAYLDSGNVHHQRALHLLAETAGEDLAVNPLTLAEVLVGPARSGQLVTAQRILDDLEVSELPFPDDAAARLAMLRAETGLKMPDCCVLLAAESAGAGAAVATFDDRLATATRHRGLRLVSG